MTPILLHAPLLPNSLCVFGVPQAKPHGSYKWESINQPKNKYFSDPRAIKCCENAPPLPCNWKSDAEIGCIPILALPNMSLCLRLWDTLNPASSIIVESGVCMAHCTSSPGLGEPRPEGVHQRVLWFPSPSSAMLWVATQWQHDSHGLSPCFSYE